MIVNNSILPPLFDVRYYFTFINTVTNRIFNFKSLEQYQELIAKQKSKITGLSSVKGGLGLVDYGLNLIRLIQAKAPTKSDVRVLKCFFKSVYSLMRSNNASETIKYLKTCSILLQQYVARDITRPHSRQVGGVAVAVTRRGLPRIIPALQRELIRKGNPSVIKL